MTGIRMAKLLAGSVILSFLLGLPICGLETGAADAAVKGRASAGKGGSGKLRGKSVSRRSSRRKVGSTRGRSSRGSSRGKHSTSKGASKPKYAYPLDFFMMHAPDYDRSPYDPETSRQVLNSFNCGIADNMSPQQLVKAGVFHHYPLSGGIFKRRENVKYIILHSTETGPPVPAKNVINAWNSMGRRHPGAQYVVDRDGTIYQSLDPQYGAVHVNIFKTLPGINNDNSIGIEMNRTGKQGYPEEQRSAVVRLITYLQHRYNVENDDVITHKYAQQGDHTDPVNMNVEEFLATKESFRQKALATRRLVNPFYPEETTEAELPVASVYVQIHGPMKIAEAPETATQSVPRSSPAGGGQTVQTRAMGADRVLQAPAEPPLEPHSIPTGNQ